MIASIWFCHVDLPGRHNGPILGESTGNDHEPFLVFGDFPGNQNFETDDG